ncbi:AMP-binding protein [Sandaracinobacter sp. RS1-74]|uniref:class I adenylate-forming enzyme family protein n=1 Tax=Sandaracinobacteroides sayramensis TaxID=2913411 RepID=UPI001EDAC51A|nr:AMP-binding protein [Sandaracinobacteroides sayramensis]MCG2840635.1 AMP-binding protein [Sandaracinobacteroides sayramensis]
MTAFEAAPLFDSVAHWAKVAPGRIALVDGETRLSYAELAQAVDLHARAMIAAGVAPGERVACLAAPSADFLVSFLAACRVGAIWIGLNPRYRLDELRYVLADSTPRLLFASRTIDGRDYGEELACLGVEFPDLRQLPTDSLADFLAAGEAIAEAELEARRTTGRQACMIVYTSGSTGAPKGAVLHQAGISAFSEAQNRLWPLDPICVLNYFPINHIGSVVDISCPAIVGGGTVVMMPKFDPRASLQLMQQERCTLWVSVPSVFQMQLDLPDFASFDLSAVQLIVWEGAPMAEPLIRRLHALHPRLATNYGMTEATSAILAEPPSGDPALLARSVGFPFEHAEVRLAGPDGQDAEEGEILLRSPLVMLGYWNRPAETAAAIDPDGWLHTGDIGRRLADGRFAIAGRIKEMYKSGGYNVYPLEVEAVLQSHPDVQAAAVVAVPDPLWDEVGYAFVAAEAGLTDAALMDHARKRLANYKLPKRILLRGELPLLPIGKVDKLSLRAEARALAAKDK